MLQTGSSMAAAIASPVVFPPITAACVSPEMDIAECVMDERTHSGNRLAVSAIASHIGKSE
jgi:hypothetical protein